MSKNILLLVEGEKTEITFFEKLSENYFGGYNTKIVPYKCNIYALYKYLESYNFDIDLIDALTLKNELLCDKDKEFIKNNKFIRRFLIFDFDFQEKNVSNEEKVERLKKMVSYFNDESDKGLLLINYPMFESIREPFGKIQIYDYEQDYKQVVDLRGDKCDLSRLDRNKSDEFIANSLCFTNCIVNSKYEKIKYDVLKELWYNDEIMNKQIKEYKRNKYVYCVNLSVQLPLIYFGESLYKKI